MIGTVEFDEKPDGAWVDYTDHCAATRRLLFALAALHDRMDRLMGDTDPDDDDQDPDVVAMRNAALLLWPDEDSPEQP